MSLVLKFGKHRGRHISRVNDGYLQWMQRNFPESSPWRKAAADILRARAEQRGPESAAIHKVQDLLSELKTCSIRRELRWGRTIHAKAVESRIQPNTYVVSALITMYADCGAMLEARRVFDNIQNPNVVAWTALLLGYAENGEGQVALDLFSRLKDRGCVPDSRTYVAALMACTSLAEGSAKRSCLERGRQIHLEIGHYMDQYVHSAIIDMYAKCGSMSDARPVFDSIQNPNVASWTALLLGYAENGEGHVALSLFSRMKLSGCLPDSVTYVAALKACTSLALNGGREDCLKWGREIHLEIGPNLNHFVQNALIDMYAKCGSMVEARQVFDSVQNPNVVAWNALLLGYADNGEGHVAMALFSRMSGFSPTSVTCIAVIRACGLTGALALGRKFHSEMNEFSANVVTCLVVFYAKCGSMGEAHEVFNLHTRARDISTWSALLAGYASFGDTGAVFNLFGAMQDAGCKPDAGIFVSVLLCCSHAGLVEKAKQYYEAMPVKYGVTRNIMHYTCMVDVLGRSNHLNEAIEVIRRMPCNPNVVTWTALLDACRKWKNVEMGRVVFQAFLSMDKMNASAHILMSQAHEEES